MRKLEQQGLVIGLKVIQLMLKQEIDMPRWRVERGKTNGVEHAVHSCNYPNGIFSTILEADDTIGVTLIINGYLFKCKSVAAAKLESKDRLKTNRGIYLQSSN